MCVITMCASISFCFDVFSLLAWCLVVYSKTICIVDFANDAFCVDKTNHKIHTWNTCR